MKSFVVVTLLGAVFVLACLVLLWPKLPVSLKVEERVFTLEDGENFVEDTPVGLLDVKLTPHTILKENADEFVFNIAEPFNIAVAAEGLGKVRFMSVSPDGRIFVPDLVDYNLSHEGKVYILEDFDNETKRFKTVSTYLSGLRGSNSGAFYTDESGNHWFYLALTAHLVRYPYNPEDTKPSGDPEIIFEFPNTQSPEAKSVVWHITRSIKFHNDRMFVSIGSGCNACEQSDSGMRGMIISANPDGSDRKVYADGLRNSVDFTWAGEELYATENGVDHLGVNAPEEVIYKITEGEHYGWPYCYELNGQIVPDNTVAWESPISCQDVPHSLTSFESRSAPLGIEYFENIHPVLDGSFLVALHGSFDPTVMHGYEVVRVTKEGDKEIFMDGFQDETGARFGRPVDFLQFDEKSFLMTDDFSGRVYYLYVE